MQIVHIAYGRLFSRVADPGELESDPDPTIEKKRKPDMDPSFTQKPDPDPDQNPTFENKLDSDPDPDPT